MCVCVFLQRAAQQLKAQRQMEEAFESRLQRMQTDMQTNVQTVTLVSSDTTLSTDTNLSRGKKRIKYVPCYAVFPLFNDLGVWFHE